MPAIPRAHYEAAYRAGKDVYAGKLGSTDAIKRLTDTGLNEASATFFVYNLRHMLKGELYQRAMSVEATRAFFGWIHRDFGDEGLRMALRALERHIPYFRKSSPSPMRGHVQLAIEYEAKIASGKNEAVAGWIFQGNNDHFRVDDYVRDFDDIWWVVRQKHFESFFAVGQPVFIWRSKGSGTKPAGIIARCRITHGPVVAKEERRAIPYYLEKPPKEPYLQVGMRVEHRCIDESDMLTKEAILEDVLLRDTRMLRIPIETNYRLNGREYAQLLALTGEQKNVNLPRPRYEDFGEAPNDDPAELRMFAAKVRRGQMRLRQNLFRLYDGKCAVTGCSTEAVLEACHIFDHTKSGINRAENGLLLRADTHCLFDLGLLTIDPEALVIHVSDTLRESEYWQYDGRTLAARTDGGSPSAEYLSLRVPRV